MKLIYSPVKERIHRLTWILPIGFAIMALVYQLGPARWVHDTYNDAVHFMVEVIFYSTTGPLIAFWTLKRIEGWLDEKEQAERKARASESRLASITSASADAILSIQPGGKIESWNKGAELLFGFEVEDIIGQSLRVLFEDGAAAETELNWLFDVVQREGFLRSHETICYHAEGFSIPVELTATQLFGDRGEPVGVSIILRDITNRKLREEEIHRLNESLNQQVADRTRELAEKLDELARANATLQRLDRMRAEFVSLVTHQIRAPLTNMSGAVQNIKNGCPQLNATCLRMLDILELQGARLDRLVQEVLNISRLEAGDLTPQCEPISVLPVLHEIVNQIQARTTDCTIRVVEKPGLPLAYADRDLVAEILANLLDNADKYSPPESEVLVEARADETEITIAVRDFGPGLVPEDQERIFRKFFRSDTSDSQTSYGYGLGLYVCHRLVQVLGGRIWAENHPRGGAVLSFTLPIWHGKMLS